MQLIGAKHHKGTRFFERSSSFGQFKSTDLYYELFGDLFSPNLLESATNQIIKPGEMVIQSSQTLDLILNTTTTLDVLGSSNANIFLSIRFAGDSLTQFGVFSTALESLMDFAQRDVDSVVDDVSFTSPNFPVWLFGKSYPQMTPNFKFTTLHVILIAEALAKECVVHRNWIEISLRMGD